MVSLLLPIKLGYGDVTASGWSAPAKMQLGRGRAMHIHRAIGSTIVGQYAAPQKAAVDTSVIAEDAVSDNGGGPISLSRGLAFGAAISLGLWAAIFVLIYRI